MSYLMVGNISLVAVDEFMCAVYHYTFTNTDVIKTSTASYNGRSEGQR